MTKPIRATRDNLLPGTIWQNAAGTDAIKIDSRGSVHLATFSLSKSKAVLSPSDLLKNDLWYKIQPVKEPTE